MPRASELRNVGIRFMRRPMWNEHAYLSMQPVGPWAYLYDMLLSKPVPILLAECDLHDDWEPTTPNDPGDVTKDWTNEEWLWAMRTYPPNADVLVVDRELRARREQAGESHD